MKTLHLLNAWHPTSGGISTFYKELLKAANRQEQPLCLVVPAAEDGVEEVGNWGRIYHLKSPHAPLNSAYRMIFPNRFLTPNCAIVRILNDERPDLVEVCDKYTLHYLAGLLRRGWLPWVKFRPTIVGISHERMDENMAVYVANNRLARKLAGIYMRHLYFPLFDHHLVNSRHTAEELIPAAAGHDIKRGVWVCPMGVDYAGLDPGLRSPEVRARLLEKTGAPADSTLLLYTGRLVPEKNLGLLLDTMRLLGPGFHLLVAGTGMLEERLRAEAPSHVTFLGHVGDRAALASLYANADIFVHPNPREPFGIAPLEAMASGLALVAPNEGGVLSYANDRNAWLSPATPQEFAATIRQVRSDDAARAARAVEGRRTAAEFRWENITARFLALYEELHQFHHGARRDISHPPYLLSTKTRHGRDVSRFPWQIPA
ncbi:MAG: glycosyltransferase [Bryobacteraceae bacterium]|nr:glycosyltransferase [Bryobacteraceae bacterium]